MKPRLTRWSSPSASIILRDESSRSGRSISSNSIARPARIASRVLALITRVRPSRQIASVACSWPVTSSITSTGGNASVPLEDLGRLLHRQRQQRSRAAVQQVAALVRGGRKHPKAAPALALHRLHADVGRGVAQLAGGRPERVPVGGLDAVGVGDSQLLGQPRGLGLGCRPLDRVGFADEHRHVEQVDVLGDREDLRRGLREHAVDPLVPGDIRQRLGVAGVIPRRHLVEVVAQKPARRLVAHVGADEGDLLLTVLA